MEETKMKCRGAYGIMGVQKLKEKSWLGSQRDPMARGPLRLNLRALTWSGKEAQRAFGSESKDLGCVGAW